MAYIYRADPDEKEILRDTFGPDVAQVMFWDADFPHESIEECGSRWELAEAVDAEGKEIGRYRPGDAAWGPLEELLAERDETVKFGLML